MKSTKGTKQGGSHKRTPAEPKPKVQPMSNRCLEFVADRISKEFQDNPAGLRLVIGLLRYLQCAAYGWTYTDAKGKHVNNRDIESELPGPIIEVLIRRFTVNLADEDEEAAAVIGAFGDLALDTLRHGHVEPKDRKAGQHV